MVKAFVALAAIVVLIGISQASKHLESHEMVHMINSHPKSTWKAGVTRFHGMPLQRVKGMLSHLPPHKSAAPIKTYASLNSTIPDEFDAREHFAGCIGSVHDQGDCNAGWAFSSVGILQDRYCIATEGKATPKLSAQDMLSCDFDGQGCDGGWEQIAWQYLFVTGVVEDSCLRYRSFDRDVPDCPTDCEFEEDKFYKYRASGNYQLREMGSVQSDILKNGPVSATIRVFEDLMYYQGGVYKHLSGQYIGDHTLKIIGWGVDKETNSPYWLVQNSWGVFWGDKGIGRILRGENEIQVESSIYAGLPAITPQLSSTLKSHHRRHRGMRGGHRHHKNV